MRKVAPVLGDDGNGEGQRRAEGELSLSSLFFSPQLLSSNILGELLSTPLIPPPVSKVSEQAPQGSSQFVSGESVPLGNSRQPSVWRRQGWDKAGWGSGEEGSLASPCPLSWLPLCALASAEIPQWAWE